MAPRVGDGGLHGRGGHTSVTAFDPDPAAVEALAAGRPPVAEPGLAELVARGLQPAGCASPTRSADAVADAEVVWVAFDTPVDDEDRADVDSVDEAGAGRVSASGDGAVVLLLVAAAGRHVRTLEQAWCKVADGRTVSFACSPENLRLGKAIEVFTHPDRVVVGVRDEQARERLAALFAPITDRIEWMSVESAEMTKHAINAFLATSVTFINEIAALCERAGADAKEVERGLNRDADRALRLPVARRRLCRRHAGARRRVPARARQRARTVRRR